MLRLASFTVDCTPPVGFPIGFGTSSDSKTEGVRDLLLLRGFVLDDGATRCLIASLSFYATHPQVANGRKLYSADAPGEAMRLVAEHAPGAQHAFFTGPGGNVTAGKYSSRDDLEGNLRRFGKLLADGISLNLAACPWRTASPRVAMKPPGSAGARALSSGASRRT